VSSEQKAAIITCASQGIGAGAVQAYRKLRYAVVASSRHITSSADPDVLTVPGDIADPETGARLVDRAAEHLGQVDTLVDNAGVFVAEPFTDYADAYFDMVTGVSLRGFFSVTRQAIAAMLRSNGTRRGHVVDISASLVDHANTAVPSALASLTKGGLNAVTRSLAIECAACGVRVNTVSPVVIRTPMHAEETYDTLAALQSAGRMSDVGDIVEAIANLETAEFVTGEILHVDGGQSAGN
jgi:NAD(P)-dependent dehydrogenase (short-subunit alcohol dehydrogenase family)